jgi:D-alanyl-D-alanine carboxypeptidase
MRFPITTLFLSTIIGTYFAQASNGSGPVDTLQTDSTSASVDAFVSQFMKRHHIPGASIAVIRDGKVILNKSY